MDILSKEYVLENGIEFDGEVCYSGEYGEQVCTKETSEGGVPVEGILYERYKNGNLCYYAYYSDGVPNGPEVWFYESGIIKSYCVMDAGTIDGDYTEWFEDGKIKIKEYCKYSITFNKQEFDKYGNLIYEKKEMDDFEKRLYQKYVKAYEGR